TVSPEGIRIEAGGTGGLFYGGQTVLQLLGLPGEGSRVIKAVTIHDYPRFTWRGMHLDVCRHFFPVAFIKRYIDYLSFYKMNRFHWHLTEDQGWRIQIRKHPRLTEIGGWRDGSMVGHYREQRFDSLRYGGFYTQEQIREVVAYAAERNVMVIPEIEMPGHSTAALAAYPELSCTGGPFEVGKAWGVYEDVYCPKEETFAFLEDVLGEVCDLFPAPYVHIGGDESPKTRWKECSGCQTVLAREGLRDEEELQSYFVKRIERFLNSRGKKLIGWDEILEGGLSPGATVMSWRGTEGGITAAREGHDAIMTPGSHCYFDHYQGNPRYEPLAIGGYTPLQKVYEYEPIPEELTGDERRHILGAQGNVWTEYISTPEQVEYMAIPRMLALSEVVWSRKEQRDYSDFIARLTGHLPFLDHRGVNYARSIFQVSISSVSAPESGVLCALEAPVEGEIRFVTGPSDLTPGAELYQSPFLLEQTGVVRAALFSGDDQMGETIEQEFVISLSTGKPVTLRDLPDPQYSNGEGRMLVDGIRGDPGRFGMDWLGFRGTDMDAVIDLEGVHRISQVRCAFIDAKESWIHPPGKVEVLVSQDGTSFTSVAVVAGSRTPWSDCTLRFDAREARFVRVIALNRGLIPDGQPGAGHGAWLFADEIILE
ncbi:MAG: family 20 glycosylhydrolase, partial [Ignavibacteria bacterium]|nr:family 20 glycosylhydrolase [Ignavibacteria bacterium]